ncbi:MAG: PEP-CTERM sorting domain-containing protein [Maioricimonas sp. JB049]
MKSRSRFAASVVAVLVTAAIARDAGATLIFVDTSTGGGQVGAFYGPYTPGDDPPASYPPILDPDNSPLFQNYFMGRSTISGFTTSERRAFFFFDMAGVAASIPAGETITDLTITLELLAGGTSVLANFTGDEEVVAFSSTSFSPDEILDPIAAGIPFEDIWDTFGSSTPYGEFTIFGPASPTPTTDGTKVISLGGAIPDLEAAIAAGEIFIVTAKLLTYDPGPIGPTAPPPTVPFEYAFGLTDVVSPSGTSLTAAPELTITTSASTATPIPEPSSFVLTSIGLAFVAASRRRRRSE